MGLFDTANARLAALEARIAVLEGQTVEPPVTPPLATLNVRDYEATGNGSTDDRAAIQSCINAAASAGKGVYFPAGTYWMLTSGGKALTIPSGLHLRGAGDTSVLKTNDNGQNETAVVVSGTSGVSITDLKLVGTRTDSAAMLVLIYGATVTDLTLTRLTFDMALTAVNINGSAGNLSRRILAKDCTTLAGCLNWLFAKYTDGLEVDGGSFEVNRESCPPEWYPHHYYFDGAVTNAYIHDGTYTGGQHVAFNLDGLTHGLFKNLTLSDLYKGWYIEGCDDVVLDGITDTHTSRMNDYYFWLVNSSNVTMRNATITGYSSKSVALMDVHSATTSNTNTIGPNVTMTNCAPAYVSNAGCKVGSGGVKPTIVAPVSVS